MSFKELKIGKVTSWPQLISVFWPHMPVSNLASDWPHTFYTPGVLFSIPLLFVNKH